jgi:hypothetical protein
MAFRWMCRAMAAGCLLLAVAISGCWKVPDNYCCTGSGCPHGLQAECTRPQVCSMVEGTKNTCVDPDMMPCEGAADCAGNPDLPACFDGMCVACDAETGCDTADAPTCNLGSHTCGDCVDEGDCTDFAPDRPHCSGSGACVACRAGEEFDDCPEPTAPYCDPVMAQCRPCAANSECGSGVCNTVSGACLAATEVAYVTVDGGLTAACTQGAPCRTISRALEVLGTSRTTILVGPGEYGVPGQDGMGADAVVIDEDTPQVTILGEGNPGLSRATTGALLRVSGRTAVTIEGMRLHDAPGTDVGDGISCLPDGGNAPTLVLRRVTLEQNTGQGIDATGCAVTLDRSLVTRNTAGGVSITNGRFTITNSFLVRNGGTGALFGGAQLSSTVVGVNRFAFNTVADNLSVDNTPGGVQCMVITFTATSNIVWSNDSQGAEQVSGNCNWGYSDIGPQATPKPSPTPESANLNVDPRFVAPLQNNYHLQGTAADNDVIDAGDPVSPPAVDFDGQPRAGAPDMGADEVVP